jgi:hypothetical protein
VPPFRYSFILFGSGSFSFHLSFSSFSFSSASFSSSSSSSSSSVARASALLDELLGKEYVAVGCPYRHRKPPADSDLPVKALLRM